MKLFDGGRAPNPRRVRVFLAEKGIEVPIVPVDMGAMEHRSAEVSGRNPLQSLPVLELDDGTILTETVAICRYFEALLAGLWWRCGKGAWNWNCSCAWRMPSDTFIRP
jgi:glutathione S-transferase